MDNLTQCKVCGGNACYEQIISSVEMPETVSTYLCFGCGMSTSTLMKKGSDLVKETKEVSPELYTDLSKEDDENLVWFPATLSIPEKGMVFVDGTSKSNWVWKAVKAIPIQEEDRGKYPEGQDYKVDMANAKVFGQKDFMDALDWIEFYQV